MKIPDTLPDAVTRSLENLNRRHGELRKKIRTPLVNTDDDLASGITALFPVYRDFPL
jgi:hypothetical protein